MVESRSNPHDAYFRQVLARPENAASELRAVLPAEITARIDWSGLKLQSGSFVTPELRSRYSDLLYRTSLDGHPAYIYILIEHQSRTNPLMAFRMLEYLVAIWRQHIDQHNRKGKTNPGQAKTMTTLPAVIPLVVHNSAKGCTWSAPTELADLIDLDPAARAALGPHLPRLRFLLDDVSALDLAAVRERDLTAATRVLLILQKIAPHNPHPEGAILDMLDDLQEIEHGPDPLGDLLAILTYILTVSDIAETALAAIFDQIGPRAKEAIMTTAERIEARGRALGEERGRALGEEHGRALGEEHGRAEALIELMTVKFGAIPAAVISRIRSAEPAQVRHWTTQVLTATSLGEMFP